MTGRRRILIVCHGNTCRSPMAGGIIRQLASGTMEVRTAGLWPQKGSPVAENAVAVMNEIGVDISEDYPKPLTREVVDWADLIVPVEQDYAEEILDVFEDATAKIRPLGFAIPDPYCKDIARYRECRDLLLDACRQLIEGL